MLSDVPSLRKRIIQPSLDRYRISVDLRREIVPKQFQGDLMAMADLILAIEAVHSDRYPNSAEPEITVAINAPWKGKLLDHYGHYVIGGPKDNPTGISASVLETIRREYRMAPVLWNEGMEWYVLDRRNSGKMYRFGCNRNDEDDQRTDYGLLYVGPLCEPWQNVRVFVAGIKSFGTYAAAYVAIHDNPLCHLAANLKQHGIVWNTESDRCRPFWAIAEYSAAEEPQLVICGPLE